MQVTLENEWQGYSLTLTGSSQSVFYQIDWEYPALASSLGVYGVCPCGDTDGTVDCAHKSASLMIMEADNALYDRCGETFDVDASSFPFFEQEEAVA